MGKRLKATRFSIEGYDVQHYRATDTYTRAVTRLFDKATKDIAAEAVRAKIDPDKPFAFEDYPSANKSLKRIINKLAKGMEATISQGSRRQWLFANKKNDKFIDSIMDTSKLSKARLKKMQDANLDALKAFQGRKVQGLDLSQRVWKYMDQYKEQLEAAIDVGLGEGKSAQQLARDVKQNLVYPDKLFRRVRDKRGMLQLSKAAKAFHPGRGVYRSSVRNAQRLTRSEINMAYRESDYQRWQSLNFVVGFEIHRSNHEPLCDCKLCSRLTGRYPKWFKFVGWHPQCMCYATPILADEETIDENELGDLKAALKGTTYKAKQPKNVVLDVTDEFKAWVKENQDAQAKWKSTPYFIRDNFKNGNLSEGLKRPVAYLPNENKNAAPSIDVQVKEAIELAEKWGLYLQANMLRHIAAANDINGINERIKTINTKVNELRTLCEQTEREAEEWGLPTDTISKAIDTHNTNNIFRAVNNLKDDIKRTNNEYKQYLSEAQHAIENARGLKIDASDVINDIEAVKADKRKYGKNSTEYHTRLNRLKAKITGGNEVVKVELKREYKNNEDVDDTMREINATMNKERWFENGDCILSPTNISGLNGFTSMDGRISLKTDRVKRVREALTKLGNGNVKKLTFEEADAMATFWHEITHNRNVYGLVHMTQTETDVMEMMNEFVARKTLPEFYKHLGCDDMPYPQFMTNRNSTGYNRRVVGYDFVITKLNLAPDKVLASARKNLFTTLYNQQGETAIQALLDGGLDKFKCLNGKKLTRTQLKGIVRMCRNGYSTEAINDYLISQKIIKK